MNDFYLDALAMIESGSNPLALGKAGERSAWQIREQAWRYTSELRRRRELEVHAFAVAGNSTIARTYARTLLEDHCHRFVSTYARTPTPGELYAMWNLGFEGFRRRGSLARCPALTKDAAQRLTNLLDHYSPARLEPAGRSTAPVRAGRSFAAVKGKRRKAGGGIRASGPGLPNQCVIRWKRMLIARG